MVFVGWVLPEADPKTKIQAQVLYLEGDLMKHGQSSGEVRQAREDSP